MSRGTKPVVVIGAGVAGLFCAAYLTRYGIPVELVEASTSPGGYFGSFRKRGFSWERGLRAVEDSGALGPALAGLGLSGALRWIENPVSLGIEDRLIPFARPGDAARWFSLLAEVYPEAAREVMAIEDDSRKVSGLMDGLYGAPNPVFMPPLAMMAAAAVWNLRNGKLFSGIADRSSFLGRPLADYLAERSADAGLRATLSRPFFDGTPVFFGLGYGRIFRDYRYPAGGMQALPDLLVQYIRDRGGETRFGCAAEKIHVARTSASGRTLRTPRAVGVSLADGTELGARSVVAACDAKALFGRMLSPEDLPPDWTAPVLEGAVCESAITAYMELDGPPDRAAPGILHAIWTPDRSGVPPAPDWNRFFSSTSVELSAPAARDPDLAPPGKTGLIAGVSADYGVWADLLAAGKGTYESAKKRSAELLVHALERLIPGVKARVDRIDIATPLTMERMTRNSRGSVAGWTADPSKSPALSDFRRFAEAVETPIDGLRRAGHWCFTPAGVPVCLLTSKLAADMIRLRGR